jgi:hypothetical protein
MWSASPAAFEAALHERLAGVADHGAAFAAYREFLEAPDSADGGGGTDSSPLRAFFDCLCASARASVTE